VRDAKKTVRWLAQPIPCNMDRAINQPQISESPIKAALNAA